MKTIKTILFAGLLGLASTQPASSQAKKTIDESEIKVLRHIIQNDTVPTVFFKTTVSELNQPLARHLFYLSDFDICSSLVNPDSVKINKEERDYIVERFSTMEVMNLNKIIRTPKNFTLKKLEGQNWFVISMPVVFREGEYAIYYSKSEFSGQFVLMRKMGGSWIEVCYSSVYVE
jgi:hypothetical protein